MIKIGTAFSTIGAPEQALKNIGIPNSIKFAFEKNKFFRKTYINNHIVENFHTDWFGLNESDDIFKFKQLPDIDLFVMSIPLNLTEGGKRMGFKSSRKKILDSVSRFLRIKKPSIFIIEDIDKLEKEKHLLDGFFTEISNQINNQLLMFPGDKSLNYQISFKCISANDVGIPHKKSSFFIVGTLEKDFKFPLPKKHDKKIKHILEDLDPLDKTFWLKEEEVNKVYQNIGKFYFSKKNIGEISDLLPEELASPNITRIPVKGVRIYDENDIAATLPKRMKNKISKKETALILVNHKLRTLTPLECFRLMGFNDNFKISESNNQSYIQARNTSVVTIYEEIFKNLLK